MRTGVFHRVGPYEIEREIGRGGMAVVFLAKDARSGLDVALKQVPVGSDRETREIVEAEEWGAKLQEQFSRVSAHVPKVYDRRTIGDHFYVAMEYVDGENLSDTINRGPLPVERAVKIAMELARFLDTAHRFEVTLGDRQLRSLLHGDLKPKNVRITPGDQVKVLDFGIAKALSLTRRVTRNDFGSFAYLSPERLESGEIDEASELWAIGVLLYEMLSGIPPFREKDTRRLEARIRSRRPPPPVDAGCPAALQAILAKTLAPELGDRYPNANAIVEDLLRFTSGRETEAEQQGWPARAADEPPTRQTRPPDADEPATKRTAGGSGEKAERRGGDEAETRGRTETVVPRFTEDPAGQAPRLADARSGQAQPAELSAGPPEPRKKRRRRRLLVAALLLGALVVAGNEMSIGAEAGRLAGMVSIQDFNGLADVWNRHDALARRSMLAGMGVADLRRTLVRQTGVLAERVIENYRLPRPTVREAQWKVARVNLARAVAAAPGDSGLRAALRYCDGHLHRINGEARRQRGEAAAAQQSFTEAVTAFREAAELRSKWADPFLGLARTFIYGLEDLDRGADALQRAESLGYILGDRETVQLADGYRARGESLARTAATLRGMPQEESYLTRAAEAYREALTQYTKVIGYGNTASNIRRTDRLLAQVEERLAAIRDEGRGTLMKILGAVWR